MSLNGGDTLARGAKSAQFSTHVEATSEFEYDMSAGMDNEELKAKYGLSYAEVQQYREKRGEGERIDIAPIKSLETLVQVTDRRHFASALEQGYAEAKPIEKPALKFKEKKYDNPLTLLDRILVKRITDNPDLEVLSDGTVRNKKTGFIVPQAYRQHTNIGIVLCVGQFVIVGGVRVPMNEVVSVGDKVTYGDYNSEVFIQNEDITKSMCDAVEMDYEEDPEGLRVVRVQDIRTVRHQVPTKLIDRIRNLFKGRS